MGIYVPPQGDEVDLQLAIFTPPDGLSVNFELSEALGTQVIGWEDVVLTEYVEFFFIFTGIIVEVYDDITLVENFTSQFTHLNIPVDDFISHVEDLRIILEYLTLLGVDDVALNEDVFAGLTILFLQIDEYVSLEEVFEAIEINPLSVYEEIIAVEDVQMLDIGIEEWDALDYVEVDEHFSTWTDWHNLWSADESIALADILIIGKEILEVPDLLASIAVNEYVDVASGFHSVDLYTDVLVEDVIDRLLVGHFIWSTEDILIDDVVTNIECYPPYPSPIQLISVDELIIFSLTPPSLSWLLEDIFIEDIPVIGQDPHLADLGFQSIGVEDVPFVSPNPLFIEVQSLGDTFPIITEHVRGDVGYPINVSDDIGTIDELADFYISALLPLIFIENIGHDEAVWIETEPKGVAAAFDDVHVQEHLEIVMALLGIDGQETIAIDDAFDGWTGQEVNVFDVIEYIEDFASVLDLVIELGIVFDAIDVFEQVAGQYEEWHIDIYEELLIEENFEGWAGQEILLVESILIDELAQIAPEQYDISHEQDIQISEYAVATISPVLSVVDWVESDERFIYGMDIIDLDVNDEMATQEYVECLMAWPLAAEDAVAITEDYVNYFPVLGMAVYENITHEEEVILSGLFDCFIYVTDVVVVDEWVYLPIPSVSVYDTIVLVEYFQLVCDLLTASIYEDLLATENITVENCWYIDVGDSIGAAEIGLQLVVTGMFIDVYEFLGIQDVFTIEPLLRFVAVYESISVLEYTTFSGLAWLLNVVDSISVNEYGTIWTDALWLFIQDDVVLFDDAITILYSQITANEEVTVADSITTEFLFLLSVLDDVYAVEYLIAGMTPLPLFIFESVLLEEYLAVGLTALYFVVYDNTIVDEWISLEVDSNLSRAVYDDVVVTESVLLSSRIGLFTYTAVGIEEWLFLAPDLIYFDVYDDAVIEENFEYCLIWLLFVYDIVDSIELFVGEFGVYFTGMWESFIIEEAVQIETSGIAVYPHDSIFKFEAVELSLDVLNFYVHDATAYEEYVDFGNIVIADDVLVLDYAYVVLAELVIELVDSVVAEEDFISYTFDASIIPAYGFDVAGIVEHAGLALNLLWTGIQTDFISIEDVVGDILCGTLIEQYEDVPVIEYIEVGISSLEMSVVEYAALVDVGFAVFFYATAIQEIEFILAAENLRLFIDELFIEQNEEIAIDEWADTKEGLNVSTELFERIDLFDILDVVIEFLLVSKYDTVLLAEAIALSGLTVRIDVSMDIAVLEYSHVAIEPEIDVSNLIAIDEYTQVAYSTDILLSVKDDIRVAESRTALCGPPNVWSPEEHINVSEWAYIQVQPIDVLIYEEVLASEEVAAELLTYLFASDLVYAQEYQELLVWPPYLIVQEYHFVSEYISLIYEPFRVEVYEEIATPIDVAWAHLLLGGTLSLTETIGVAENTAMQLTHLAWYLGAGEEVSVIESLVYGLDWMPLLIADDVALSEYAHIVDLVVELAAYELAQLAEWCSVGPEMQVAVFDGLAAIDQANLVYALMLAVVEALGAVENFLIVKGLGFYVADYAWAIERAWAQYNNAFSAVEMLVVGDYASLQLPFLCRLVFDTVALQEHLEFEGFSGILVRDIIAVVENTTRYLDALFILSTQTIAASEAVIEKVGNALAVIEALVLTEATIFAWHPTFDVFEELTVAEAAMTASWILELAVESAVVAGEYESVNLPVLLFGVEDVLALAETLFDLGLTLPINVAQMVAISENVSRGPGLLLAFLYDALTVAEWITRDLDTLFIVRADNIAALEWFGTRIDVGLSVVSAIALSEYAASSLNLLHVVAGDILSTAEYQQTVQVFLVAVVDALSAVEYVYLFHEHNIVRFDHVFVWDTAWERFNASFSVYEDLVVAQWLSAVNPILYIDIYSLVRAVGECYFIFETGFFVAENVQVEEMFVWGLPVQFISVHSDIEVSEDLGFYVTVYTLYPILFNSPARKDKYGRRIAK